MDRLLHQTPSSATIALMPANLAGRFDTLENQGAGVAPSGYTLFLCPKSVLTSVRRSSLWWGGLLERFLDTACQTSNPTHRPNFDTFSGGLLLKIKEKAIMLNSINAPLPGHKPQSLFNVIDAKGAVIASDQPYFQAFFVAQATPNSRIKFERMVSTKAANRLSNGAVKAREAQR